MHSTLATVTGTAKKEALAIVAIFPGIMLAVVPGAAGLFPFSRGLQSRSPDGSRSGR